MKYVIFFFIYLFEGQSGIEWEKHKATFCSLTCSPSGRNDNARKAAGFAPGVVGVEADRSSDAFPYTLARSSSGARQPVFELAP